MGLKAFFIEACGSTLRAWLHNFDGGVAITCMCQLNDAMPACAGSSILAMQRSCSAAIVLLCAKFGQPRRYTHCDGTSYCLNPNPKQQRVYYVAILALRAKVQA
eukprot:5124499-Amphidinium_carterae.2